MLVRLYITIVVYCVLGKLLCDIDPNVEYTWYSGIWHGLFFVANFVRSWFTDALYKAEIYTSGYNVCYWIFSIWTVLGCLFGGAGNVRRRY